MAAGHDFHAGGGGPFPPGYAAFAHACQQTADRLGRSGGRDRQGDHHWPGHSGQRPGGAGQCGWRDPQIATTGTASPKSTTDTCFGDEKCSLDSDRDRGCRRSDRRWSSSETPHTSYRSTAPSTKSPTSSGRRCASLLASSGPIQHPHGDPQARHVEPSVGRPFSDAVPRNGTPGRRWPYGPLDPRGFLPDRGAPADLLRARLAAPLVAKGLIAPSENADRAVRYHTRLCDLAALWHPTGQPRARSDPWPLHEQRP